MAQPLCSREWKKGVPGDKAAEKKEGAVMTRYTALLSRNHHDDTTYKARPREKLGKSPLLQITS